MNSQTFENLDLVMQGAPQFGQYVDSPPHRRPQRLQSFVTGSEQTQTQSSLQAWPKPGKGMKDPAGETARMPNRLSFTTD